MKASWLRSTWSSGCTAGPVLGSAGYLSAATAGTIAWTSSHLAWSGLVMAGILALAAGASSDDYTKPPCNPPCRWPQECNYETAFCECRSSPCNRVVLNGMSCQEDVDCAQFAAFSHCVRDTCLCLPGYTATAKNKCEFGSVAVEETTTFRSWRPPPTPHGPGPADYSGVVKLALGAAIVMLAGVILALVWNLYRERRRAAQGLSRPPANRRRRQQGGQRNSGGPHTHDLPPSYNDIFIISGAEAGRRHEKPPSYEEAMQDQQFAIVAPLAFVNYGFTGEGGPMAPTRRPTTRNPEASGAAAALAPSPPPTSGRWQTSLNVASIMNRLGGSTPTRLPRSVSDCGPGRSTVPTIVLTECENVDNSNFYPPTNYDGLNVRRTKSGRAPHRRSASDLSRTESMASVAESCCSASDIVEDVTLSNVPNEVLCDNNLSASLNGGNLNLGNTILPHCDSLTTNQYPICDVENNVVRPTQSSVTVELDNDIEKASSPSLDCETSSTKVPNGSNGSGIVSHSSNMSLPLTKEDAHSNADVSFC